LKYEIANPGNESAGPNFEQISPPADIFERLGIFFFDGVFDVDKGFIPGDWDEKECFEIITKDPAVGRNCRRNPEVRLGLRLTQTQPSYDQDVNQDSNVGK
jgi:hypothetical protein